MYQFGTKVMGAHPWNIALLLSSVTEETSQPERSELNAVAEPNIERISVTEETSQPERSELNAGAI